MCTQKCVAKLVHGGIAYVKRRLDVAFLNGVVESIGYFAFLQDAQRGWLIVHESEHDVDSQSEILGSEDTAMLHDKLARLNKGRVDQVANAFLIASATHQPL